MEKHPLIVRRLSFYSPSAVSSLPRRRGNRLFVGVLSLTCLCTLIGQADQTAPLQVVFQPQGDHRVPPYTLPGTVPPFSVAYARFDSGSLTFFRAVTVYKDFTNSTTGTMSYTVKGTAPFSLEIDGVTQASDSLVVNYTGNVGPGKLGRVGDTISADQPTIPLATGASASVKFISSAGSQVTSGATLETFGSVSVVYNYTPVGQTQEDPIELGQSANNLFTFEAAPSGRWYRSPTASGVRYGVNSANGRFTAVTFPNSAAGSFRVQADGLEVGAYAAGSTATFSTGAKSLVVVRVNASGGVADAMALPLAFMFDQSTVDFATAALTPSEAWRVNYFGTAENSGTAADLANPAGDGLSNLVKYALNLDPRCTVPSPIVVDMNDGHLRLTTSKNLAATDVTINLQASSDLGASANWSASNTTVDQSTGSTFQAHDNVPVGNVDRRFIRLQVTRP